MVKERILIQGSSWTVGAYIKSDTTNSDTLTPGGLADLLKDEYDVVNISVGDDFNLGTWSRLEQHLKQVSNYSKILVCQNDPLRDLCILRSGSIEWRQQFDLSVDELFLNNINTVTKLVHFLLGKFYKKLDSTGIPTYVFAGPSQVVPELMYNLHPITPSWTEVLVPGVGSITETSTELDYAVALLLKLFPENSAVIKQEFINYADMISNLISTWKSTPELFAYHHPTERGNRLFYNHLRKSI
jgi:hypothetical protein